MGRVIAHYYNGTENIDNGGVIRAVAARCALKDLVFKCNTSTQLTQLERKSQDPQRRRSRYGRHRTQQVLQVY